MTLRLCRPIFEQKAINDYHKTDNVDALLIIHIR